MVAQSYAEELDAPNFVRAIEDLYYTYGEPTKFRDSLLRQLMNEETIDVSKPETLLKLRALIGRVFRAFGGDSGGNIVLFTPIVMDSIKMTPETALSYKSWLSSTRTRKNLKAFEQWLEWEYSQNMEDQFRLKTSRGYKNLECQPVLTKMVHPNYEELLKARCLLCFGKVHAFEGCHVYMSMTPNQRKIALTIYKGCFLCTKIVYSVHVGSSSNFCDRRKCWMPCETCQSHEHHFSICEASNEPFKAVLNEN